MDPLSQFHIRENNSNFYPFYQIKLYSSKQIEFIENRYKKYISGLYAWEEYNFEKKNKKEYNFEDAVLLDFTKKKLIVGIFPFKFRYEMCELSST